MARCQVHAGARNITAISGNRLTFLYGTRIQTVSRVDGGLKPQADRSLAAAELLTLPIHTRRRQDRFSLQRAIFQGILCCVQSCSRPQALPHRVPRSFHNDSFHPKDLPSALR
jgi:hypothetical protein